MTKHNSTAKGTRGNNKHNSTTKGTRGNKNQKNKPKRPLSAYNIFFQRERRNILLEALKHDGESLSPEEIAHALKTDKNRPHRKSHGKISFVCLVKQVAAKWNALPPGEKITYELEAKEEQRRYQEVVETWKKKHEANDQEAPNGSLKKQKASSLPVSGAAPSFSSPPLVASLGHTFYRKEFPPPLTLDNIGKNANSSTAEIFTGAARLPLEPDCHPSTCGSIAPENVWSQDHILSSIGTLSSQLDDDCYELLSSFRNQPPL